MPEWKEPHFFGEYRPPGPCVTDMEAYLDLFRRCSGSPAVGEASTQYLYSPSAAGEIYKDFPNARIVIVLRNPVDRAYSLYWHHVRDGVEIFDFEGALGEEESRISNEWPPGFHHVRSGMYSEQIRRFLEVFGRDAVKVLLFDDLKADPEEAMGEICRFLNVDDSFEFSLSRVYNKSGPPKSILVSRLLHSSSRVKRFIFYPIPNRLKERVKSRIRSVNSADPPSMKLSTRLNLINVFRDDIKSLERLIGRDLSTWLEVP
jgi:hypothetical protein